MDIRLDAARYEYPDPWEFAATMLMEHLGRGVVSQFFWQDACLHNRVECLLPYFGFVVCIVSR